MRPNRASGSAPPPPPAYGGYSGGYSAGGSSYYQQPQQPQQPHYQPNYHAGGYGAPGGGAGGGYNAGYNGSSHSNSSYGGYGGGSPIYSPPAATVPTQSTFKDKPTKRAKNGSGGGNMPALVAAIVAFLFLVSTLHYRGKLNSILTAIKVDSAAEVLEKFQTNADELRDLAREKQSLSKTERRWSNRVTSLEKEIASLEEQLKNAHIEHEKIHEEFAYHREAIDEHTEKMASRDNAWRTSAEILQAYTKRESRRVAEERYVNYYSLSYDCNPFVFICSIFVFQSLIRFGLGPHHVRFSVVLPSDPEHTVRYFVVECAPLDLMPHAVHLFLEQVMHGLWNNAWFYLNGPHVLQGGPQAEEGEIEERGRALQRFKDLGLDTLAFPEYSEQFPHVQVNILLRIKLLTGLSVCFLHCSTTLDVPFCFVSTLWASRDDREGQTSISIKWTIPRRTALVVSINTIWKNMQTLALPKLLMDLIPSKWFIVNKPFQTIMSGAGFIPAQSTL